MANQLIGWSQFTSETNEDELIDQVCAENYFQVGNDLTHIEALIFFGKQKPRGINRGKYQEQSILNIPALAALPVHWWAADGQRMPLTLGRIHLLCDEYFQDETMLEGPLDTIKAVWTNWVLTYSTLMIIWKRVNALSGNWSTAENPYWSVCARKSGIWSADWISGRLFLWKDHVRHS